MNLNIGDTLNGFLLINKEKIEDIRLPRKMTAEHPIYLSTPSCAVRRNIL